MTSGNRIDTILLSVAGGVVLVGAILAWPGMSESWACRARLEDLQARMADRPDRTDEVERLAELIEAIDRKMAREFRTIPTTANVAGVVAALSVPVDGRTVHDQTFAAHAAVEALPDAGLPSRAMPLTVDMRARFDAVFSLLRTTESMDRLVRVSSFRLSRNGEVDDDQTIGPPILSATIGLEAIYEPEYRNRGD